MKKQYIQPTLREHKLFLNPCMGDGPSATYTETSGGEETETPDIIPENAVPFAKAGYFDAWE